MKAFILAAGRGERMKPLTNMLPKVMLDVGGKPLIVRQLEGLRAAGITDIVINTAYMANKIQDALGNGDDYGVRICYSQEPEPLETGGAICQAREMLGDDVFLLVNGDVWSRFNFSLFTDSVKRLNTSDIRGAHLLLVKNPDHNPSGDFMLENGWLTRCQNGHKGYTFAGISLISPELIDEYPHKRAKFPLREVFYWGIANKRVTGELFRGVWVDVGTPERLAFVEQLLVGPG